ncbi:MAG: hypothetical protein EOO88_29470 [Pedobacter sp.]|nr:MAG: hypothetical protein EOO88_29470 [Pedobacter sp.]
MVKRPHLMTYTTAGIPGGEDPETGLPLPDQSGEVVEVPCRFHQESSKVYKNEDSTEVAQVGRIRFDAGITVPTVGTIVSVVNLLTGNVAFNGPIRERYEAQKSGRVEV